MVRFLSAVSGTRGEPFLSPRIYRAMVAPPPPPLETRPGAKHVGLGWDAVRNLPNGDQFSKNGAKPGVSAWLEHFPNGVDWAFMINTTNGNKDEPNPAAEIIRRVGQAIGTTAPGRRSTCSGGRPGLSRDIWRTVKTAARAPRTLSEAQ